MNSSVVSGGLPPAQATGLSIEAIEKIAEHFLSAVEQSHLSQDGLVTDGSEVDVFRLVELFNGEIKVAGAGEHRADVHGTLEVRAPNDWTIYLANHTGPLQDRFTLAHELGHYVLHARMGMENMRASRTCNSNLKPDLAESEADAFALALLMPRDKVAVSIEKYGREPNVICAEFGVEPAVAKIRLDTL